MLTILRIIVSPLILLVFEILAIFFAGHMILIPMCLIFGFFELILDRESEGLQLAYYAIRLPFYKTYIFIKTGKLNN